MFAFTFIPSDTPGWVSTLLWVTGAMTGFGVVWTKIIRPGFKAASAADQMIPLLTQLTKVLAAMPEMLPLLQDLTKSLGGTTNVGEILEEIVEQVRNDHGSSLHDTIDKVFALVAQAQKTAEDVAVQLTLTARLEERSQSQVVMLGQQVALLLGLVDRLGGAVQATNQDALAAHRRADVQAAQPGTAVGQAADAAAQSGSVPNE